MQIPTQSRRVVGGFVAALTCLGTLASSTVAQAQAGDGINPTTGLTFGTDQYAPDGYLYGVTSNGGTQNFGTIFRISPTGQYYTVLHSFTGTSQEGGHPQGTLCQGADRNLYGVTPSGVNWGTVFKITPTGTFTTLYIFDGTLGANPTAITCDGSSQPNLYIATYNGTLVKIANTGTVSLLHTFNPTTEGKNPIGGLFLDNGVLYGTTSGGGTYNDGTIYSYNLSSNAFTVLRAFAGADGNSPRCTFTKIGSTLYGTTRYGYAGNGNTFQIQENGTGFSSMSTGFGGANPSYPAESLVSDTANNLYGVTTFGGPANDGALYKASSTSPYTLSTVHAFNGQDGNGPQGPPVRIGNLLYGITATGGYSNSGVLYEVNVNGSGYTVLHTFNSGWSAVAGPTPQFQPQDIELLSDATVMVLSNDGKTWYRLTPDSSGNYANGTWSASTYVMNLSKRYFASSILPDGKLFVAGGEYANGQPNSDTNNSEVFDPTLGTWTDVTPTNISNIGDAPCKLLGDGTVLVGSMNSPDCYKFAPNATPPNQWTIDTQATKRNTTSSEESWALLADGSVLTVNCFGTYEAERYIPAQNQWVDDAIPSVNLVVGMGEIGPALRLTNGKVLYLGAASGTSAIYTPSGTTSRGSWVTGPHIPDLLSDTDPDGWSDSDGPACVEPGGKVLFTAGKISQLDADNSVIQALLEFDPSTNSIGAVPPPLTPLGALGNHYRFLALPNGQILFSDANSYGLQVFKPMGSPNDAWRPTIQSITKNGTGYYHLTGTQLTGLTEGAAFGDDADMATNFPIVRVQDTTTNAVWYAKTAHWTPAIATGANVVSTDFWFTVPQQAGSDPLTVTVIANGISSAATSYSFP